MVYSLINTVLMLSAFSIIYVTEILSVVNSIT
nr:MAG TPA: hypothetical protein [Caudoviricetes sp.]